MDLAAQIEHAQALLARHELAQCEIDRLALGREPRQPPSLVQHGVVDLDVRPDAHYDTPSGVCKAADRLRQLVGDGMLERVRYRTDPDWYEYRLTERGRSERSKRVVPR
jgi:hypothetical protein